MVTFRSVATAAYCARQLYYRRQDASDAPLRPLVRRRRDLAFRYDTLLAATDAVLADLPLAVSPTQFRSQLNCVRERLSEWPALVNPTAEYLGVEGEDCRGLVHKFMDGTPPSLSMVFTGSPPSSGVWHPQRVHVVAAATALSDQENDRVLQGFAEYPAHGIVRKVPLDRRRTAEYRRALRTTQPLDEPPARTANRSKCAPCEYSEICGVPTRSLRSRL